MPGHQFQVYLTHSPNHAYMHEIIHLEPPPTWKNQPRKKSLPKATKRLEINTPSKGICKGKNHQQKQKCTKATKTLQINTFLKGIGKGKSDYSIPFHSRYIKKNIYMYTYKYFEILWWCPASSFLCTSHSPNHAYMHEIIHLEPTPTWKKQPAKKESTKSYKKAWNQYSF